MKSQRNQKFGLNPELGRDELIAGIAGKLASVEILRQYLLCFSAYELDFFREAANNREVRRNDVVPSQYGISHVNCLLSMYYHGDEYIYVMPEEIRSTFNELEKTSFTKDWERCELLRAYGRAAVELYGVIKVTDVIGIFNAQNSIPAAETEFLKAVSGIREGVGDIAVEAEYLYSEAEFMDEDWEDIELFAREAAAKHAPFATH